MQGATWTLAEVISALAPPIRAPRASHIIIHNVVIDSREATAGSLFVALAGERVDGHDYVGAAFQAGAVAALVSRPVADVPTVDLCQGRVPEDLVAPVALLVPDTLEALQTLAQARRAAQTDLRVIGVTGSVGKTTAKETLAAVLATRFATLKNPGNRNNEIGLPLTLLELESHERAVLEMGMYDLGEIALLCRLAQPQVGVVLNVGPTHLERLGTIERIAQAKAELVQALPADGLAILNGDDPRVRPMAALTEAPSLTFGLDETNTLWASDIESHGFEGITFVAHLAPDVDWTGEAPERALRMPMMGRHAAYPALAAALVGLTEGLTWDEIQQGLLYLGQGLRLVTKRGVGGSCLIDDTYNASPASTLAALDLLDELPGRHIAVLGDMLELGSYAVQGHREVGARCAAVVDHLFAVGELGAHIAAGARDAGMDGGAIHAVEGNEEAIAILRDLVGPEDTVLVKGSRGMAMEEIVQALEETG
jgi:UDP-N-acetylmuramoyl-tripeptide--D-alanyl-D-alanine ligase